MYIRSVVLLMMVLLWTTPSAAYFARHLAITVQQQTGRELNETSNSTPSEEERTESQLVVPLRRAGLDLQRSSSLLRLSSSNSLRRSPTARTNHEGAQGELLGRNGCGSPLTC